MFELEGEQYSLEQVTSAAEQSNMSLDDYLKKYNINKLEEAVETVEKLDGAAKKDADVVPVATPSRASIMSGVQPQVTESPSVDTSLELQDPKPKKSRRAQVRAKELARRKEALEWQKEQDRIADSIEDLEYKEALKGVDQTLSKAGSSIWSYSPENISNLYSKTTGESLDYKTILNTGSSSASYTGIFNPYNSYLTGGFSYYDFANEEKINGISISELQKIDQANAASSVLESIIEKHGDKSDDFVVDQGQVILKGKDKKLQELYSSLRTATAEEKQGILDQIKTTREDDSQELFDINTGNLVKYDKLPEESKKDYDTIIEKAEEKASTTELGQLKKELTNSYSNLVGISKRISSFVDENGEYEITKGSHTLQGYLVNLVKDFFGSEETTYGDLSRVQQIANTGVLPENVSKISGEHPLVKAYNTALQEYAILNQAVQTNTDPLSEKQEGFWESIGDALIEKVDMTGGVAAPKVKANANQIFVESLRNAGLSGINQDEVDEAVSQNWRSVIGGGTIDLSLLIGELYASKKLTGNKVQKGFKWLSKAFNNSKAAKSSKIVRKTGNMLLKGGEEMTVFEVLETGKTGLGLSKQSTREEDFARRQFAFSLGIGNSLGSTILRAMPAKSIFSPILAQLSKSDLARSAGNRFVNANAGAFSFEFARAMTAALGKDEEGYFDRSPEEFVLGYVTEGAKMGLLGAKSIFHKNGIYRSFQRDLRLLNLNPTYVNNAAKRTGINPNSVRKPGEETINEIDAARADKMSGIDAKLKTQQITKEQAKKEIDAANKDYNILEAEAELNLAKERVKAEDKSALKPTDESVRILINKMKKGQKFNDKDNNALVNTPLPIIYDRMGIDPSTKSLEGRWNREFAIEDIMNNNTSFKAPYGSKERAESYKFIDEAFEIGGEMQLLKRLDNRTEEQEKQLQQLEKDYKVYEPGGYKYDRLQDKLDELYLKQRLANKAQAEDVLGATKEGESVSIRSAQDFQEKYNSIKKDGQDVTSSDGFYDAKNKIFYINEEVVAATRNTTVDKHEVGHFVLRDSLKDKTGKVTDEGVKVIDEVLNELTPKQRETVQKRIDDFYRYDETELNSLKSKLKLALNEGKAEEAESITEEINKLNSKPKKERNKKDYYEEYLTVLSDAINDKQIVFKENVGNAFEKFVPFLRKKMPELELNANTGKNLFELIKSYSKGEEAGIEAAKEMSIAAEGKDTSGQQISESISKKSIELKEQLEDLKDREFELEQGDFDAQKSNLELKIRQAEKSEARDESESIKTTAVEKIKPVKKLGIIDEIVEKATAQKLEAPIVSDKNKKIASVNEDIVKEMTALGANKVSEIKDKDVRQSIVDRLGRNNVGAVTELAKKAAFKGKDLAIDEELKVGYDEFIGGFSAELSALINSYKANVNGKKVPFGAYMNQNLPLRYPAILRKSLEGKLKKSESLSSDKNIKKQVASIESDSNDFELGGKDDSSEELIVDQIDVRKFGPARDKVDEISKIVEVEKGERPSYKDLANKYLDQVSMELFNVPGKKIKGGATLKDSEAKSLQALFINPNNVRKLFKTMPPYNVAGSETTIGEQGETIGVSKDVKGKSIGLSNKFMIKFYQPVTRAIPGISSPKGRSLGLTSQGQVYELKPEFRGRITNDAIKDIQRSVGVTEKGVPSEKISDANRSKYGTTLTGFAKAYVANVINVTGRSKQTDKQEQADTGAGKARIMFSKGSDINENLKNKNDNYKRFRNSILNKDMFHGGSKTTSTEATWFYLDNPEAAKMWGDGKVYKTNSSLLKDQLIIPDLNDVSEYHKHASKKFGLPEENFFDVRNIMKLSNAGEIINDWIDWVAKNKTDWDLGYNLYEQGSLTEGIAVTVIGKIPESKLESFKEDLGAGKASIMFSKTAKENKEFSEKFKSNEVKKLVGSKFEDFITKAKLPDTVAQEIKNVINSEDLKPIEMFQVVSDIASRDLSIGAKRNFQEGLITDLIKAEGKDFGAVLVENLKEVRKIFKKEYEAIGFGMEVEGLKESIKGDNKETRDAKVIDWLLSVSRSVRSSKNKNLLYVSTNKKLFDSVLKDIIGKDSDFEAVQKKLPSGKIVSFIKYKGEGLEGFQDITELKSRGFRVYGEKVSEQADKARELAFNKIDSLKDRLDKKEITKGQYDSMVDSYLSLISLDQKGLIRKMSKPNGEIIDGYRATELYLEHKMAAQEIKELLSSYAEGKVEKQEVLDTLEKEALVNIMPKTLEKSLPNFAAERAINPNYKNSEGYKSKKYLDALEQYKPLIKDMDGNSIMFSKSQKVEKAKSLDKAFNDIIENKTGIPSRKRYGIVEATTKGASKGKFNFFIPPSAEDFVGLLYPTLGKGKVGDSQMQWYKDNLISPYAKAMNKLSQARVYILNNYKSLKNQLGVIPKDLSKKVEGTDYTKEMAVRVYIWNKQKMNVPGISNSDVRKLSKFVTENENLQTFGDQLINLQLGDGYIKPKEGWAAGTITTDILEGLNTTKRSKYLQEWQENADVIFSEDNMNKLQAVYGLNYVKAMKNMLGRMKSGRNRNFPGDSATGRFTDWVTGSVGVTMFLNTRSAVLQTISAINFVNFTDNNILAAGKAFANQPQYWKDFMMLMNSDFLKERRGGLRINVSEADIADMAKKGGVRGAISKLLELGFAPTQIADSFAIASGGSTFYRNRVNTYKKQGLTEKQAKKKAFEDFRETAEESQQSSRADRISMQQASPVGRFVLAFANTPAQYARIIKKAASDLKNGRGDRKANISKIIYYGAAQNLLFNALQQALFATALDDEEPKDKEKEKKYLNIANGMMDSLLRGTGIGGSVVSVGKNAIVKLVRELEKDRPKIQNVASEVLKISPPVSAKYSRLVQAGKSYDWNKDEMKEKGLSLDNPAYLAGSQVVSALTNIPLDRAIKKANNVVSATSQDLETWERLALLGGWQDWELGIDKEDKKPKIKTRSTKKVRKKIIKKKLETKLIE
jgi:hypothetical protein